MAHLNLKNPVVWSEILAILAVGVLVWVKWGKIWTATEVKPYFGQFESFCVNQMCLAKEDGGWMLNDTKVKIPANNEAVEAEIKKIKAIILNETISQNPAKFADMGIDDKLKVTVIAGDKKLELGNISSDYSGTYVKAENGQTIFKAAMVFSKEEMVKSDYWARKTIINLPRYQVKKITLKSGNKTKEISAKDGKWEDEKWVDRVSLLNSINYLANFKPDETTKTEMDIETEGETKKLILGRNKLGKDYVYYASDDGKYYFEIKKEDFDLLTGKLN